MLTRLWLITRSILFMGKWFTNCDMAEIRLFSSKRDHLYFHSNEQDFGSSINFFYKTNNQRNLKIYLKNVVFVCVEMS